MLGGPLGGGRGWKEGVNEDRCLYIIKDSEYSVVFGEEKLIHIMENTRVFSLIDNMDQLLALGLVSLPLLQRR
jgi:hypothetical protein